MSSKQPNKAKPKAQPKAQAKPQAKSQPATLSERFSALHKPKQTKTVSDSTRRVQSVAKRGDAAREVQLNAKRVKVAAAKGKPAPAKANKANKASAAKAKAAVKPAGIAKAAKKKRKEKREQAAPPTVDQLNNDLDSYFNADQRKAAGADASLEDELDAQ
jgi:hypothetical protein